MATPKAFVCLCEDVTVDELRSAIRIGVTDIEEIKRYTGIGTGPCQGKQCLHTFRILLAEETGVKLDEIPLTSLRPPKDPMPFGAWAADESKEASE